MDRIGDSGRRVGISARKACHELAHLCRTPALVDDLARRLCGRAELRECGVRERDVGGDAARVEVYAGPFLRVLSLLDHPAVGRLAPRKAVRSVIDAIDHHLDLRIAGCASA